MPDEAPQSPPDAPPGEPKAHLPVLQRLRRSGRNPRYFGGPRTRRWFTFGVLALAVVALLPLLAPQLATLSQRLATLLALVFLMGSVGLWFGMGGRAFAVAVSFVLVLYALTAWTRLAFPLQDFFVVAVVVSFAIFALAGFNLVFILEEVVYDAHVHIHLRHPAWNALPTIVVLAFAIGLPAWHRTGGGPDLPTLWTASVACSVALLGWWFLRAFNDVQGTAVLRELHLFVAGTLAVTGLADAAGLLHALPSLAPSLVAYLALLGTWVYTSYTTLQRTHFLLSGRNAAPWVAILLGASFAILAHAQVLFQQEGTEALADLTDRRVSYLMAGVWIGIVFYVVRGLWRLLRFVQQARGLGARGRHLAGRAARVAGALVETEVFIQQAAEAMFRGLDEALPGEHRTPHRPIAWELDPDGDVRPIDQVR